MEQKKTDPPMEKRGVIEPGRTPPESERDKSASDLESHTTQRLADHVADSGK